MPDEFKAAVKRVANQRAISEPSVIRESVRAGVAGFKPRPRGALFSGSKPTARRADEFLDGFGER